MENINNFELDEKIEDWYVEMKVYNNGDHYIGIPHTKRKLKKRYKVEEEEYVVHEVNGQKSVSKKPKLEILDDDEEELYECPFEDEINEYWEKQSTVVEKTRFNADMVASKEVFQVQKTITRKVTRSGEFARLYEESTAMVEKERRAFLIENMKGFFKNVKAAESYVDKKIGDKKRAGQERAKRFRRKANNVKFEYFVTFTYDDKKQTEESFEKKLMITLRTLALRHGWKYMGVWERGENGRLHFHAFVKFPKGEMPGELEQIKDYNFRLHDMKTIMQNTYFFKKFGRNDFSPILQQKVEYAKALRYIMKYITKDGTRIVSSRGIPMYYVVTTRGEGNVACKTGRKKKKVVLRDDFECWTEDGEFLGNFGENLKKQLPYATS